jgi:hypothetical protein
VRHNLAAIVWKDNQNTNILINIHVHSLPPEGNFCDEHGNALKLAVYKPVVHVWLVDKSDRLINSYTIS